MSRRRWLTFALTLGLLYGASGCECTDADDDGVCIDPHEICHDTGYCYTPPADCDDNDPDTRPGALDMNGDGIDRDCNGVELMEVCDFARVDEDHDFLADCEDPGCAGVCAQAASEACAAAKPLDGPHVGAVSEGPDRFRGSCFSDRGAEDVFSFTPDNPGEIGELRVSVDSVLRYHVVVRASCDDPETEIACIRHDEAPLRRIVTRGEPVTILVDGDPSPSVDSTYTLTVDFTPAVCGDGVLTAPETCDDGGTTSNDGCSAECTIEPNEVCADAPLLDVGYTSGDTREGTSGFQASCSWGEGRERLFRFVPPKDGQLYLGLASETSQLLYVRRSCDAADPQVVCTGTGSTMSSVFAELDVKAGEPLVIFVDAASPEDAGPFTLTVVFDD